MHSANGPCPSQTGHERVNSQSHYCLPVNLRGLSNERMVVVKLLCLSFTAVKLFTCPRERKQDHLCIYLLFYLTGTNTLNIAS